MCLAVPALLVQRDTSTAIADLHGNRVEVSTALVPDAQAGDWVLVHAGFAIQKLDGDDVKETWAVLQDLRDAGGCDVPPSPITPGEGGDFYAAPRKEGVR